MQKTGDIVAYNEYVVEFIAESEANTKFKFVDATSPSDASSKIIDLPNCVRIVGVTLCDQKYWGL